MLCSLVFTPAARAQDYVLGEGDLLRISVYENDDLTTQTRVSGDGKITFPLVGEFAVGGLTVHDAEAKLTRLLADGFILEPHVTMFIMEYRSQRVTILGEVVKPGLYELNGNVTLLEIISRAGGLNLNAGDTALIQKKSDNPHPVEGVDQDKIYSTVNLKALMEKGDMSANYIVQDGDSIFITKSGFVYVMGEVQRPGAYKMEAGTTVMKAIALAGGLTDKAAPGRTKLLRKIDGAEKEMEKVDMNSVVKPDDVITVPESYF